ncbi:MAG TPA: TA system VapC family ribonuclease toxin [Candidatus Dormibacteraeota bacterium]|nr:TA system VapC family ribonuclease toxin [Candidatus Dormibacteraeota bacterium]
MIAVDTNILVYAHRRDATWHEQANRVLQSLAEGPEAWAIPWPCLHEFLSIVTHPRIYRPPTPLETALDQVAAWLESPGLCLLAEASGAWDLLRKIVWRGRVTGPVIHDARVATLCLLHGVRELWTVDRDFGRFADLKTRNPLIES